MHFRLASSITARVLRAATDIVQIVQFHRNLVSLPIGNLLQHIHIFPPRLCAMPRSSPSSLLIRNVVHKIIFVAESIFIKVEIFQRVCC